MSDDKAAGAIVFQGFLGNSASHLVWPQPERLGPVSEDGCRCVVQEHAMRRQSQRRHFDSAAVISGALCGDVNQSSLSKEMAQAGPGPSQGGKRPEPPGCPIRLEARAWSARDLGVVNLC
jgi:hypothetical protein